MNADRTESQSSHIGPEKLLAVVRGIMGEAIAREDHQNHSPPGPWDPVIRAALESIIILGPRPEPWMASGPSPQPWHFQTGSVYGPSPEPWKRIVEIIASRYPSIWDAIDGGSNFGGEVALNPQPLPPRYAFLASLAHTVTARAGLLQDIEDAARRTGEQQGIIIVSGYFKGFADDVCGNDFRFKWPFPWPRPNWFAEKISASDLVVLAMQFEGSARDSFSQDLRQHLMTASSRLVEAGMSKM